VFYGIPASTPNPETALTASIFPNPVADQLNIQFSRPPQGELRILVRDLMGKTIYFGEKRHVQAGEQISILFPNSAAGLYLLEIQTEAHSWVQKIVKK